VCSRTAGHFVTESDAVDAVAGEEGSQSGWTYLGFTLIGLAGFLAVAVLVWVTVSSFVG